MYSKYRNRKENFDNNIKYKREMVYLNVKIANIYFKYKLF